jgi:hypothetical protein
VLSRADLVDEISEEFVPLLIICLLESLTNSHG